MEPESAFLEANGIRIHYLAWGDPDAPPILLLHPTGFLARTWQPVAEALAGAGHRAIAPDARGHGDSGKPRGAGAYHWRNMAADLEAFLDHLSLSRLPVAGHSMGGGVAAYVAAQHPDTFTRLVLIEPIIFPADFERPRGRNDLAEGARRRRMVFDSIEDVIESYRDRPAFERWQPEALRLYAEHGTFRREDGRIELKCPGEIEAHVFDHSLSLDIWSELPRIQAPVLLIRGALSEGPVAVAAQSVADRAPHGRLLSIDGAGHMAPMEKPDAVAREILAFIDTTDE